MDKKTSLNDIDLQRLAELVNVYLKPSERFSINGKGEVSLTVKSWLARLFKRSSEDHYDFLEVVGIIVKGIMDVKGVIPFIATTCDNSIDILIDNNDRSTVIAKLYTAHIIDEDPQIEEAKVIGQKVTIESKQRMLYPGEVIFRKEPSIRELNENVCALLNGKRNNKIVIIGKR